MENTLEALKWKVDGKFIFNDAIRQAALAKLAETPFPTTRVEAWKYTRTTKIKNGEFAIQTAQVHRIEKIDPNAIQLVFVNGFFNAELSDAVRPDGLKLQALSTMDPVEVNAIATSVEDNSLFPSINTAFATDGVYLHVSAKMQIEPTIEIVHIQSGTGVLTNVRHYLAAEAFSKVNIIYRFVSDSTSASFGTVLSTVNVAKNAHLTIDKIQEEQEHDLQFAQEWVNQAQDSTFTINTLTLNGGWVRNNLNIEVNGVNCETNLNGAYILKGNQHVDNHTVVDHKVAHCQSNEMYKGVMTDSSTAVFNGKVFVRKDAQKINAFQSNGNVLLSNEATVNSKPELEIYADDVKCSHGSTTGQLDENAVFYLRARGISEASARQLLVGAFIGEVLEKIDNEHVLQHVDRILVDRFGWT